MIANTECCTLILSDNDISTATSPQTSPNEVGVQSATRDDRIWFNINMRDVVGPELYNKYEYFNLRLNAISYSSAGSTSWGSNDNRVLNIFMEGLPFVHNTYDSKTKVNTNRANIGNFVINIVSAQAQAHVFDGAFQVTFRRCENVNIRIYFEKPDRTPIDTSTNTFPRFNFYFNIFPVM